MTKIPWTDESWNPVIGCTKIAGGCKNCYAEKMAKRFWKQWGLLTPPHHFGVKWFPERLDIPLHWRKPRKVFVCSMSDLFHPGVPVEFQMRVFNVMGRAKHHVFQILTKRPERMNIFVTELYKTFEKFPKDYRPQIPYPNIWLGTSISTQADADKNIPILLQIPAAVRFLSIEPMLEPICLSNISCMRADSEAGWEGSHGGYPYLNCLTGREYTVLVGNDTNYKIDQVIIGCESGPKARLCSIEVIRDAVRQCKDAGVACFVKQIPLNGKCSKNPSEWPEDLRIQEYPTINR